MIETCRFAAPKRARSDLPNDLLGLQEAERNLTEVLCPKVLLSFGSWDQYIECPQSKRTVYNLISAKTERINAEMSQVRFSTLYRSVL